MTSVEVREDGVGRARDGAVFAGIVGLGLVLRLGCSVGWGSCPWAMGIGHFVPPGAGIWMPVAALGLTLLAVFRVPSASAGRLVAALAHPVTPLVAGLAALLLLPDRLQFLGDSILRQGDFYHEPYVRLFPQATPLDVALFTTVRHWTGLSGIAFGRVLGLLGFIGVWLAAVRLSKHIAASRESRAVVLWTLAFSGYLLFCSGYGKVTPLVCGAVALSMAFAVEALTIPRALLPFALTASLAMLLHRSGLAVLPVGVFLFVRHALRVKRKAGWAHLLSAGIFGVTAAVATVNGFDVFLHFDLQHNLDLRGNMPVVSTSHLINLLNVLVLLAPSSLLLPAVGLVKSHAQWRTLWLPAAATGAVFAVLTFVNPPQGAIRDWDVFALVGLLLSMFLAAALGGLIDSTRPSGWLPLAMIALVTFPTIQWMVNAYDRAHGLERIHAISVDPHVPDSNRAQILDYLGTQYMSGGQWAAAAATFRTAVSLAPHRRLYLMWALAETATGDYGSAADIYRAMLDHLGPNPVAYLGLAGADAALGDTLDTMWAVERLRELPPRQIAQCVTYVRHYPQVWPTGDLELLRYALEPALRRGH